MRQFFMWVWNAVFPEANHIESELYRDKWEFVARCPVSKRRPKGFRRNEKAIKVWRDCRYWCGFKPFKESDHANK